MLTINGLPQNAAGVTLAEWLRRENYDVARVAVERNGNIVPRTLYADTTLEDGDTVEIVSFVGGG